MVMIEQIQQRLSEVIKQSGYSQTELAKRLGVRQQTISHYVKGNILPSLDTLANLCIILDISSDYILGIDK